MATPPLFAVLGSPIVDVIELGTAFDSATFAKIVGDAIFRTPCF
jgi:hypothetical protein